MTDDPSSTRLGRAATIFVDALALPESEREAFLDEECAGNAELRGWIEAMLSAREEPGGARPTAEALGPRPVGERAGDTIGRYKLLQQIGEGGFGVVFMGEQTEPVQRRVALKIIKLGMDTKQVIARFEAERQALAMMEHPNIARVFDAGTTDHGRPYFVMELVKGESITKYCDRNSLTTRERLELVKQVCAAVQHAHRKGVIHRDIKPGNILVTIADGKPVPKVIDFGIAKATNARLTARTLFTEFRQLIGTPEYMSPEQAEASGVDVDTRTDVYSLGVLLYELVTGTTPFDPERLRSAAYGEIQRIIREEEAPRPSMKLNTLGKDLSTVAAQRREEPEHLTRVVRGELDWIIMKALEKDRSRRYGSADELGEDIGRYLNDDVVLARPASRAYRARKFVRKHRAGVAAAALLALAVVAGLVGTGWGYFKSERAASSLLVENEKTRAEAARADAVQEFLLELLRDSRPTADGPGRTVRDLLNDASEKVSELEQDQPLTAGYVHLTLGDISESWGLLEEASAHAARAIGLLSSDPEADPSALLQARANAAVYGFQLGDNDAVGELEEIARIAEQELGADYEDTLEMRSSLGAVYSRSGRHEESVALLESALRGLRANDATSREYVACAANLVSALRRTGDLDRAERVARETIGAWDEHSKDRLAPDIAVVYNNLAQVLLRSERVPEAIATYEALLHKCEHAYGVEHIDTSHVLINLGVARTLNGEPEEAIDLMERGLSIRRSVLGDSHERVLGAALEVVVTRAMLARDRDAAALFDETLDLIHSQRFDSLAPRVDRTLARLQSIYTERGSPERFEQLYRN